MTKRESRVIEAFLNCIRHGEYSEDYAITLIEDNQRYGWMSETSKDYFYEELEKKHQAVKTIIESPSVEETLEEGLEEESEKISDELEPTTEENETTLTGQEG